MTGLDRVHYSPNYFYIGAKVIRTNYGTAFTRSSIRRIYESFKGYDNGFYNSNVIVGLF